MAARPKNPQNLLLQILRRLRRKRKQEERLKERPRPKAVNRIAKVAARVETIRIALSRVGFSPGY
jgi:hypothetical protein